MTSNILSGFIASALFALASAATTIQLPGQFIYISAKGDELWGININNTVFRFNVLLMQWKQIQANGITGRPITLGASPDGYTWLTTSECLIFRYNPSAAIWEPARSGSLCQVNAISKDVGVGVGMGNSNAYGTGSFGASYLVICDNKLVTWAAGGEGTERWFIERNTNKIYRTNKPDGSSCVQVPTLAPIRDPASGIVYGSAATLDVQSATRAVMTTTSGRAYMWSGSRWVKLQVDNAAQATIGKETVFILDETQTVTAIMM